MIQYKFKEALIIREAIREDAKIILEYLKIIGGETNNLLIDMNGLPYTIEEEEKIIEDRIKSVNSKIFLGFINGKIVSSLSFSGSNRKRIAHNVDLGISVLKAFWGRGIGQKMMEYALDYAKGTKVIKNVFLEVRTDNIRAIKFYEKQGFEKLTILENKILIEKKYYDDVLMVKHL
ncbi:MAG: GNAT family N-acetyltransferase [Acholeplasmataceae bacterium]|nr:GNAT family N-acetyltransferase [Acholeplasmataceae bacterium]